MIYFEKSYEFVVGIRITGAFYKYDLEITYLQSVWYLIK